MTITYRSVALVLLALTVAVSSVTYLLLPNSWLAKNIDKSLDAVKGKLIGEVPNPDTRPAGEEQAHFTNLDGSVTVKKASSSIWQKATYDLQLEKGDIVKTDSQGIAKMVFADKSTYTIKEDSLIVIEENSTLAGQQTNVAVSVPSGTIDLATGTLTEGSRQELRMAGSKTEVKSDTTLQASNDPRKGKQEVLVKSGQATFQTQGGESVALAPFERVSYSPDSGQVAKNKEIAPPTLISPGNLAPIFAVGGKASLDFSWTPVETARTYHLRLSKNQYFSVLVMEKRQSGTELKGVTLPEGPYYWLVQSIDATGKESIESEKNKFNIVPKGTGTDLALEVEPFVQHGHVIKVSGKTEPEAVVLVNGQQVPLVGGDGTFTFFTPELPNGENLITITAQNQRGAVATQTRRVVIQ